MTVPRWRKSTRSNLESDCVELAHTLDTVRDSKNPAGATLAVVGLAVFLNEIKRGRFDR